MGISTLRRYAREDIRDAQPGLISREDHNRVVQELEERFGNELSVLRRQLEEANLARHELSKYQKDELVQRRGGDDAAVGGAALSSEAARIERGGESVPTGSSSRTSVQDQDPSGTPSVNDPDPDKGDQPAKSDEGAAERNTDPRKPRYPEDDETHSSSKGSKKKH